MSWKQRRDRDQQEEADRKSNANAAGRPPSRSFTSKAASGRGNNNNSKHQPGDWVFDVAGDQEIFRYGLNPYTVPLYSRAGGMCQTKQSNMITAMRIYSVSLRVINFVLDLVGYYSWSCDGTLQHASDRL